MFLLPELNDRFADITDLETMREQDIVIRVWFLDDGGVFVQREYRPTTEVIDARVYGPNHEVSWCYRS